MKVAFLDRDGTIIEDYPDEAWRNAKAPVFLNGAFEALRSFRHQGYEIIVVTNQYLIGEGIITLEEYETFHRLFLRALQAEGIELLDVFFCPHARADDCACCKPKPGLIQQALEKYPAIDLKDSFLAGDSPADFQLANAMGLKFFGIALACPHPVRSLGEIKDLC